MSIFGNFSDNTLDSFYEKEPNFIRQNISFLDLDNEENKNLFDIIKIENTDTKIKSYENIFKINNPLSNEIQPIDSRRTELETQNFLNKKMLRESSESFTIKNDSKEEKKYNETKGIIEAKSKGRIKKVDKPYKKGIHTKYSKDNIIKRIKSHVFKYISNLLNNSFKDKRPLYQFHPLNKYIKSDDINKESNIRLLNATLKDIYKYSNIDIHRKIRDERNSILIDKIYEENTEEELIKILEKTFKDILNDIRERDLDNFLNDIKEKEIRNNNEGDIDKYINEVKIMLFNYENWFEFKRERKKKIISKE